MNHAVVAHVCVAHGGHRATSGSGVARRCVVHAAHARHVVAHVGHGQDRARVQCRHRRVQPRAHGQRGAGVAGAAHVLGEHGVGILPGRLDDHVEGLGHGHAEFVHRHRMHVLAVHRHHGHLQAGDAHVEVGHCRAVDAAQQQLFAAAELAGPVGCRRQPVDQIGVSGGIEVGQVGRRHPHPAPHAAVGQRRAQAVASRVAGEVADRALVVVVVRGHLLEPGVQRVRVQVGPVRQQDHVLAVPAVRRWRDRVDQQRAVQAGLLLEHRMAVVPVGAGLAHGEAVQPGLARRDAVEAHARHAVHVGGQHDAVPVHRGGHVGHAIGHAHADGVAFLPAQDRRRQRAVDGDGRAGAAGEVDGGLADGEVETAAGQLRGGGEAAGRQRAGGEGRARPRGKAGGDATQGEPLDEAAARGLPR